jgi:hypothetical protein
VVSVSFLGEQQSRGVQLGGWRRLGWGIRGRERRSFTPDGPDRGTDMKRPSVQMPIKRALLPDQIVHPTISATTAVRILFDCAFSGRQSRDRQHPDPCDRTSHLRQRDCVLREKNDLSCSQNILIVNFFELFWDFYIIVSSVLPNYFEPRSPGHAQSMRRSRSI